MALAIWNGTVTDAEGNVVPGAQVTVRDEISGRLASLFTDRNGVNPISNPFTAGEDGHVRFHTQGGAYSVLAQKGTFQTQWRYVGVGTAQEYDIDLLAAFLETGTASFRTKAELDAFTPNPGQLILGAVQADPDHALNGYYTWNVSSEEWEFARPFPETLARLVNINGTANARTADAFANVAAGAVTAFFGLIDDANTGPMTLSINGGAAKDVVNAAGNALSAGEFQGGVLFFLNDEDEYQLINDASAAVAAAQSASDAAQERVAAEDAADRAEAAAAGVEFPVSYAPQTLTPEQKAQARTNIGVSASGELFKTVDDMLADDNEVIGYDGSGAEVEASVGFVFYAQGFRYEVVASDATDAHVETAGGVKLYELADDEGFYNFAAWGAVGDGSTDNSEIWERFVPFILQSRKGFIPEGTFIITSGGNGFNAAESFTFMGVPGRSILKRKDGVISTALGTSRMLRAVQAGGRVGDIAVIQGIVFDQNYQGQAVPSPSTEFQQATACFVRPSSPRGYDLYASDLVFTNSIGDGIAAAGGPITQTFGTIFYNRMKGINRPYTRSDLQITASWDRAFISNADVTDIEVETNSTSGDYKYEMFITNVSVDELDLHLANGGGAQSGFTGPCFATNLKVRRRLAGFYRFDFYVDNFEISLDNGQSLIDGRYRFSNGRFFLSSTATNSYMFQHSFGSGGSQQCRHIQFDNVQFDAAAGLSSTLTEIYQDNNAARDVCPVIFRNCRFMPTFARSVIFQAAQITMIGNSHHYTGSGACIAANGNVSNGNDPWLMVRNDRVMTPNVYLIAVPSVGTNGWRLWSAGNIVTPGYVWNGTFNPVSPYGSGSVVKLMNMPEHAQNEDISMSSGFPTQGFWQRGEKMYYANPSGQSAIGLVCTVAGAAGSATFQKFGGLIT